MTVCRVPLTRGLEAVVDEADYPLVSQYVWQAQPGRNGTHYAATRIRVGGKRVKVYMHRLITGAPKGAVVHHFDDDGLNNRRANLALAGFDENAVAATYRPSLCGYRGVSMCRTKFRAKITVKGVSRHLGVFGTAEEAAAAYDQASVEIFGEAFAWTNARNRKAPEEPQKIDIPF